MLSKIYDAYPSCFTQNGQLIGDAESYRGLAESIRMHPDQDTLESMLKNVGFENTEYLIYGWIALHRGFS